MPIVVAGAGAAGLVAAIFAASGGAPVLLLESMPAPGKKILISGGGRCNVLPSQVNPGQFVTGSSRNSLKNILNSWPLAEVRRWFERDLELALKLEPESGKLFPVSDRARDVLDALLRAAERAGVELRLRAPLEALRPPEAPGQFWQVLLAGGESVPARRVILATGGLSVPQTGSTGAGLRLAAELGHEMVPTYAALTPLTSDGVHAGLAGVSFPVHLAAPLPKGQFTTHGGFLFTHRGYSGPAVLDISHLAVRALESGAPQPILVQWTGDGPEQWEEVLLRGGRGLVFTLLRERLPDRLAERLLVEAQIAPHERTLGELRRDERRRLVGLLARYPLPYTGHEGYKKAEVTGGGVHLSEVDPRTLESRRHRGLFLCGEMLDAFGPIGGYNFLWAWVTGRLAGLGAAAR
ncbi:MAG TPA: aminoacetone oxidase family FAD-binding enzyme [Ardenticatenaceae bacterium]|nr:aminoacetone oxidase family FAD-binding enzyme [Ardenticatenaceae bacterium]